jgi:hypothetical protein
LIGANKRIDPKIELNRLQYASAVLVEGRSYAARIEPRAA